MAQYQYLGNITRCDREGSGVLLQCGDDLVRLSFLTGDAVRLTLARKGKWEEGPEYALAKIAWPGANYTLTETPAQLTIKTADMEVRIKRAPCRFAFYDAKGNLLNQDDEAFGMAWDGNEVAAFKSLLEGERFFGLGEKTGGLDRRGREYVMWNADAPAYTDRTDPLYQSHPFFIGIREGRVYGIFFNNTHRSYFNMGAGNHRMYFFRAEDGPMSYFFFTGPTLKHVVSRYSELVGRMPLPPQWALGYQQSRYSYFPESEVRTLAKTFRDKEIPVDAMYLDIHYMDGYRCFTFDKNHFPDPARMFADLLQMGLRVVTIVDPGIKVDSGYAVNENGVQGNHFIKYPDGELYVGDVWPGKSHFTNYTRAESRQWWGDLVGKFVDHGIAGIWNDMNEPAVWGREAPPLVEFEKEGGKKTTLKEIHNVFGHLMAQATYEGLRRHRPNERPFILTRAGFAGTQRYAASWTGDNIATFEHLEIAIRLCQSMGLSAIPFTGADVGGFLGTPSQELFARWMQVGAFTPFFRTHTEVNSNEQEPWSFGEEVEEINRRYIELRYRLLPYTYTQFQHASVTGLPILKPLFLEYADDPEVYHRHNHTTYLWGDDILVAPVTREGQRLRKVYLPKGQWHDFWENRVFAGGQYIYVDAPLEKLPLFVRGGAVIPMGEVQQYVGEKPGSAITLQVYPGENRTCSFYEDDGLTFAFETGAWALTRFNLSTKGKNLILKISGREGDYVPPARAYKIILHGQAAAPKKITINGQKLRSEDFSFDTKQGTTALPAGEAGRSYEVVFSF
ncbi:MAG: glycoside hydrolase family 31 protein [bacterium]